MKKGVVLGMIVLTLACTLGAQPVNSTVKAARANQILSRLGNAVGTSTTISLGSLTEQPESTIIGDSYWDQHFGASSIQLYQSNKMVEGYYTRYDIHNDEFEFRIGKEIKVLRGVLVNNIVWIDSVANAARVLVNAKEYKKDGVPLTGSFFEVLTEGKHSLFKEIAVEILKPDFNPALNMGSHDYRIAKHIKFYFNIDNELVEIKSKKSMAPLIEQKPEIDKIIKREKTKFNNELSLQFLFSKVALLFEEGT